MNECKEKVKVQIIYHCYMDGQKGPTSRFNLNLAFYTEIHSNGKRPIVDDAHIMYHDESLI